MTEKQKRFCDYYIADPNATQAAIKAGYSEDTAYSQGSRLLKDVEIQDYLNKKTDKLENKRIMSLEEVLENITNLAKTADKDNDRLKALELLGKRYAAFTDRVQNEVTVENKIDNLIDTLTEE